MSSDFETTIQLLDLLEAKDKEILTLKNVIKDLSEEVVRMDALLEEVRY
jgi:hypothetical protein